jgi:hypothetical protein
LPACRCRPQPLPPLRACLQLTIREFEQNGVRVREGTKLYLDQNRQKALLRMQAPGSPSAAAAAAAAAHPAAAAAQQQAMMGGAAAAAAAMSAPR